MRARFDRTNAYVSRVNARSACNDGTDCRGEVLNRFAESVDLQLNTLKSCIRTRNAS